MIPAFNPVLDRVLAEPALVEQCGVEVSFHRGRFVEQVLRLSGDGLLSYRSSGNEVGEEAIGTFEARLPPQEMKQTLKILRETPLDQSPSKPAGPRDLQGRVSVLAAGEVAEVAFAVTPFARYLDAWLERISQLEDAAVKSPRSAMRLEARIAPKLRAAQAVEITLAFVALGTEGMWITHPASLHAPAEGDQVFVSAGFPDSAESKEAGGTKFESLPIRFEPVKASYLWLAPGKRLELKGKVHLPAGTGLWIGRAAYSSWSGKDQIAGRPRLRGTAFSNDLEATVEKPAGP